MVFTPAQETHIRKFVIDTLVKDYANYVRLATSKARRFTYVVPIQIYYREACRSLGIPIQTIIEEYKKYIK